ncbi:MAG: coenzyme F420-0:L-glutamate ligase, partial [Chloroflexota bacterium]
MTLTLTAIEGIPLIKSGDDISQIIHDNLLKSKINLIDGDIIVIAQKIISKSENRFVNLVSI